MTKHISPSDDAFPLFLGSVERRGWGPSVRVRNLVVDLILSVAVDAVIVVFFFVVVVVVVKSFRNLMPLHSSL